VGWVVHVLLEGSIKVGEGLGAASEAETLAEVVTTLGAEATVVAHNTSLDGYSLADHEVPNTGTNRGHDASGFVAENQGCLKGKVAVPAMDIIMDWQRQVSVQDGDGLGWGHTIAPAETGGDDLDLSLIWTWGPKGAFFIAEVFGAVENSGVLRLERGGGHGGRREIEDKTYDGKHGI